MGSYYISLSRDVLQADVKKQKLDLMPGFRISWHYCGIEVEPDAKYYNDARTMTFVRHYSNNISTKIEITTINYFSIRT